MSQNLFFPGGSFLLHTLVLAESEPGMYLIIFQNRTCFPISSVIPFMVDSSCSIENWDAYEP